MLTEDLNQPQREAVMYNEGPSLIIAGAGSGKTRVLTCKVAYLLHLGLAPHQILALTFTNKAAREMRERVALMVDAEQAKRLAMGTFHSVFARILRTEANLVGLKSDYTIYDTADSKNLIKSIVKEMSLDEKIYKANLVLSRISSAKNNFIVANLYAGSEHIKQDFLMQIPRVKDIYSTYVKRCMSANAVDFDDILLLTTQLFKEHPEVLEKYQNRFQFILVDEYQDTNLVQFLLIKSLAEKNHKVCVVGDDAQSIYAFRGANIENILKFSKNYPEAKLFKLERNYRSSRNIVAAAGSLIAKNRRQIPKNIFSEKEEGDKIKILPAYSDVEEALIVSNKIGDLKNRFGYDWKDFAVLYRTNAQSRLIEDTLRKRNIPYVIYGGLSFYQRKEVKDVLAYIRLILNTDDEEAFKRIINYPTRGIGDTTISKLSSTANLHHVSLFEVASNALNYALPVNVGTAAKLKSFVTLINELKAFESTMSLYDFAREILLRSNIPQTLNEENTTESESARENIEELLNSIRLFEDMGKEEGREGIKLSDFMAEVALLTDMDLDKNVETSRVTLMTIHSAKGLEFKNVFVTGLEESLFPSIHAMENDTELEEERRLLYVAITRSEEHCFLSYAKSRYRNGSLQYPSRSRFVDDIDPRYLEFPMDRNISQSKSIDFSKRDENFFNSFSKPSLPKHLVRIGDNSKPTANNNTNLSVKEGMRIEHERFGIGTITRIDDTPDGTRIYVDFETSGSRVLLLKFTKFKIIS
ncbi:MAG: ATP-dependent DNA helicase [Bacteroidia bacterium]|nr:ATP-dependent DNA helicase [Bacteroidia bacterium]